MNKERGEAACSAAEVPSQKIAYLDNNGVLRTLARINAGRRKHMTKQWPTGWTAAAMLVFGHTHDGHVAPRRSHPDLIPSAEALASAQTCFSSQQGARRRPQQSAAHRHGRYWLIWLNCIVPLTLQTVTQTSKIHFICSLIR